MKELSIEEKAKRYDEALGRAKEKYAMFEGMKQGDVLEDVFPELSESEDERIRKEIFNVIKSLPLSHERTGMLCWLENQGEKRHVFPKFRVGDTIQSCFNKQAIDKVIRIDDDIYILGSGGYVRIEFQDNWKLVEQKPEWSEEEETYRSYILTNCMHYADAMGYVDEKKNNQLHKKAEDWLKSLKDRVGCEVNCTTTSEPVVRGNKGNYGGISPNSEWSEDDKERVKETLAIIETVEDINKAKDGFLGAKLWLKSLKDRVGNFDDGYKVGFSAAKHNQWKPSDKQMELLKEACDQHWEPDGLYPLYTLYQDLKKLKE